MSWLSDNYEKAALGGAALVAIAIGVLIFKNKGETAKALGDGSSKKSNETDVAGLADIEDVRDSFGKTHEILPREADGRAVNLFTGVALFSKKNNPLKPVDLLTSDPVHPGIENTWWLKYNIDPGFSDAPQLDPDKDGFTNREEYLAKTHPKDFKSHPDPVNKLTVSKVKTTQVHIKPTDFGGGQSVFKLETKTKRRLNRMGANSIKAGTIIPFKGAFMKGRFKFDAIEKNKQPSGITETIWVIEDLKPNKLGTKYRFDRRGNLLGQPRRKLGVMDSTVELTLKALGQGGNLFKVEENTRFSLPFDPKAAKKPYLLKKVDLKEKAVEVEYLDKDGKPQLHLMKY